MTKLYSINNFLEFSTAYWDAVIFQLTLDKKLIQCIVFINYDVIHYVIFLKRGSQALVFTYLPVSLFSPCPGAVLWRWISRDSRTLLLKNLFSETRIDALSHWTETLQMSACSARAESFFLFSKTAFWCCLIRVLTVAPVSPTYCLPHEQGIMYTPDVDCWSIVDLFFLQRMDCKLEVDLKITFIPAFLKGFFSFVLSPGIHGIDSVFMK